MIDEVVVLGLWDSPASSKDLRRRFLDVIQQPVDSQQNNERERQINNSPLDINNQTDSPVWNDQSENEGDQLVAGKPLCLGEPQPGYVLLGASVHQSIRVSKLTVDMHQLILWWPETTRMWLARKRLAYISLCSILAAFLLMTSSPLTLMRWLVTIQRHILDISE